jgi:predicted component of type VI protein secretion system
MSRLLMLAVLAVTIGCQENKPPTQAGPKAVEVKTTAAAASTP